jgi:hypothetical protein
MVFSPQINHKSWAFPTLDIPIGVIILLLITVHTQNMRNLHIGKEEKPENLLRPMTSEVTQFLNDYPIGLGKGTTQNKGSEPQEEGV